MAVPLLFSPAAPAAPDAAAVLLPWPPAKGAMLSCRSTERCPSSMLRRLSCRGELHLDSNRGGDVVGSLTPEAGVEERDAAPSLAPDFGGSEARL